MKFLLFLGAMLGINSFVYAQQPCKALGDLPAIRISRDLDIHILSPEPIQYADISTRRIAGDLPVKNILRIRMLPDSVKHQPAPGQTLGVVTIIGESFIAQYRLIGTGEGDTSLRAQIEISSEQTRPLDYPGITMTQAQMQVSAVAILSKKPGKAKRKASAYGITAKMNHIYSLGNEVFLDISFENNTNLRYTPDELRFKVEDKKIVKATNVQSLEIKPEWQLYPLTDFKWRYHNIYVLKKLTFPDNKILNIELSEKQVSGRTVSLKIRYGDLLKADTF